MRCGISMLRIYPSNTFWNRRCIYCVARSAKYVRVLRWTQVWPLSNLLLLNTSGIRAAAQRIKTAKEGSGFKQKQVCSCKLVAQKWTGMFIFGRACGTFLPYSLYLHRLFSKVLARINCRLVINFCPLLVEFFPYQKQLRMPLVPRRNKFALQTCSSRMYTDVHSWSRVFSKHDNLIVYKAGNIVDYVHIHDIIKLYVFYRAWKR